MEISSEAKVDSFTIGPNTLVGRAIALRILFCRSFRKICQGALILVAYYYRKLRKVLAPVLSWLNPRNPQVWLPIVLCVAIFLKRHTNVKAKARSAYRRKFWRNLMRNALTYDEWSHAAKMLEKESYSQKNEADFYDEELVRNKLRELVQRRQEGGLRDIIFCLRADLVRNLGNMCNPQLHKARLQVGNV